ncbi:MAG TPA: HAD family hydrolase [Alphaproteobacteria bacterium]|nr:HAD family hydrolase [Alphaproteobacteria bacterium]
MFWPFNVNFKKQKLSMVCFDFDNTLCDYAQAEAETEVHIISIIYKDILKNLKSKTKHSTISQQDLLKNFNAIKNSHLQADLDPKGFSRKMWLDELFRAIHNTYKIDVSKLIAKSKDYEKEYWRFFNNVVKLYSNTIYTLDYLKSSGLKIALVTNSDGERPIKLNRVKHLKLDKYFDYIITSDDTKLNKPDPAVWNLLIKESGINPKECMMVGDHPDIDLASAKKLGMITVWTKQHISFDLRSKYVDYEISDIQEVCNIVKNFSR